MKKFETGKSYTYATSPNHQTRINIVRRTPCFITFTVGDESYENTKKVAPMKYSGERTEGIILNGHKIFANWEY